MKSKNSFTIYGKLPGMNEIIGAQRANRYKGASFKKRWQKYVESYIIAAINGKTFEPCKEPCVVYMKFTEKNRRRDVDNVQSSQKIILDAMQTSGAIQGDSPRFVRQVYHDVTYGKEYKVEVSLYPENVRLKIEEEEND